MGFWVLLESVFCWVFAYVKPFQFFHFKGYLCSFISQHHNVCYSLFSGKYLHSYFVCLLWGFSYLQHRISYWSFETITTNDWPQQISCYHCIFCCFGSYPCGGSDGLFVSCNSANKQVGRLSMGEDFVYLACYYSSFGFHLVFNQLHPFCSWFCQVSSWQLVLWLKPLNYTSFSEFFNRMLQLLVLQSYLQHAPN